MTIINLSEINVLAVDDNSHMLEILGIAFGVLGITDLRTAGSGRDGFVEVLRSCPDIVFCDVHMDNGDGISFVRNIRRNEKSPNTRLPVIMVSGHSDRSTVAQARDAGANDFMVKPISAKALYTRLVNAIERPRPFLRSASYFGPCRRRRNFGPPAGVAERRADEEYEFI